MCALNLPAGYAQTENPKPDWRPLAAMIDRYARPDDVMVFFGVNPYEPGYAGFYYIAFSYYCHDLPRQLLFPSGPKGGPTPEQLARLRRAPAMWVIVPWDQRYPPEALEGFEPGPRTGVFLLPTIQRWTPAATQPASAPASSPP
jgi:hypothetical protein